MNYIKLLKRSKSIALFSHSSPDPDTIGSTVALCLALEKLGKKVDVFCESEVPETYFFLEKAKDYNGEYKSYDLMVSVDIASSEMFGKYSQAFCEHNQTLRIDHHINGENFAKTNIVKPYSACAILVFEIINKLKVKITPDIATVLYFAICGDTGIFHYSVNQLVFEVCAKLVGCGADIRKIYSEFFDKKTLGHLKLSSKTLFEAKTNDEQKYAILIVSKNDYEKYKIDPDNDNLSNLPNSYISCGYAVAAILKEKEDGVHCSIRSKFEYDISTIAVSLGGGGHKNASGCKIDLPLEKAKQVVEEKIKTFLKGE